MHKKQPLKPVRPKSIKIFEYKKYISIKTYFILTKKPDRKGAIDVTKYTLAGTNKAVSFKNVKSWNNKDFHKIQISLKKGVKYFCEQFELLTEKEFNHQIDNLDDVTKKFSLSKCNNDINKVKDVAVLLNIYRVKSTALVPSAISTSGGPIRHAYGIKFLNCPVSFN